MIDQLKSMAIFAQVVDEKSFRGAAKKLLISPSIVSLHIKKLEEEIGAPLLYRSTRALSVTREGEQFYKAATVMVKAARNGLEMFGDQATEQLTELRVAIPETFVSHPVFGRIIEFAKNNTGIRLNLISSDVQQNLLSEGYDVAIRMGVMKDSDLKMKRVSEERRIVVAAPSYLASKSKPLKPEDLKTWDFISFSAVPGEIELQKPKVKPQLIWGRTVIAADSVKTVRKLAIAGFGVATLPYHEVQRDLNEKRLKQVLPEWSDKVIGIYVVWPRNADINLSTRKFINYLSV